MSRAELWNSDFALPQCLFPSDFLTQRVLQRGIPPSIRAPARPFHVAHGCVFWGFVMDATLGNIALDNNKGAGYELMDSL